MLPALELFLVFWFSVVPEGVVEIENKLWTLYFAPLLEVCSQVG